MSICSPAALLAAATIILAPTRDLARRDAAGNL